MPLSALARGDRASPDAVDEVDDRRQQHADRRIAR
jgi:hypothetical protein